MPTALETTTSTCTAEAVQGKHVFDIRGYSQHKGLGIGKSISSGTFTVGGYGWSVRFYPGGYVDAKYVSVFLELISVDAEVRASCDLRLVNQGTGVSSSVSWTPPRVFRYKDDTKFAPRTPKFKKRSELEASAFVRGDRLTIECVVTVFKCPKVSETSPAVSFEAPPSDLSSDLRKFFESMDGADVCFIVGAETFSAHRTVLAIRSPIFKAELYAQTKDSTPITISNMQPAVFKALLHYIYVDSLPAMDDLEGESRKEMITHLLVAADRFAIQRLKLICESALCRSLDAETVVAMLSLAGKHRCRRLRQACLEFIASSVDRTK